MVSQIYTDYARKIYRNKTLIEKTFGLKVSVKDNVVYLDGKAEDEFRALEALEAINLGFSTNQSLLLKEEDVMFRKISIRELTNRKDLERVRGRIVGKHGKTLEIIEAMTNCLVSLHDNIVGIIGRISDIDRAEIAILKLIQGSRHSSVYSYLEKQKADDKIL